jgi:hypothetical protein
VYVEFDVALPAIGRAHACRERLGSLEGGELNVQEGLNYDVGQRVRNADAPVEQDSLSSRCADHQVDPAGVTRLDAEWCIRYPNGCIVTDR